jgi:ketosteroid isomerase-like protein
MTSRAQIEETIRSLYVARVNGDLDGTLKDMAEDATFGIHARGTGAPELSAPIKGRASIRAAVEALIADWQFKEWKEIDLLVDVDKEKALLHWRARVQNAKSKKSEIFYVFDIIKFRDGKIVDFQESTDTALMMSIAG